MARRTFEVIDIVEILVHWHAGRSKNEIAASLGEDRKTIRKYVAPAEAAGLVPGGPALAEAEWTARVRGWFPELADARLRQVTWPAIAAHHEFIAAQLRAGVRMSTIHQRLVDEHGLAVSVASLRRYVHANIAEEARRVEVTVRALAPAAAGEQAQVDYGRLGTWTDPASGRPRTVWAFVMVLAFSRHMFVRPVLAMDQHAWTEAHVEAFGFFGGVPARIVPDNLKTGVDRPDLYDPKLNRAFSELAAHYGVLVDPAPATSRTSSGRCPTSATASGAAGPSPPSNRCAPTRCAGAGRSPAPGPAGRWTAPPRWPCSTPSRRARCGRCHRHRSPRRAGRRRKSARTSTPASTASSIPPDTVTEKGDVHSLFTRRALSARNAFSWSRSDAALSKSCASIAAAVQRPTATRHRWALTGSGTPWGAPQYLPCRHELADRGRPAIGRHRPAVRR